MKITSNQLKSNTAPDFCFNCNNQLSEGNTAYSLEFGIAQPTKCTLLLCRDCLKTLSRQANRVLKKDITKERKTYVRPLIRSTAEFFRENELPFKTAEEYQAFLAVNVLPEITEAIYVY